MSTSLRHPLTELPFGATLRIDDGQDHAIAVFEGQVWITQDGDPRDIVVGAGESFSFDRPGLALVQAIDTARLTLMDAEPLSGAAALQAPVLRATRYLRSRWAAYMAATRPALPARF